MLKEELKDFYFGVILASTILLVFISVAKGKFYSEAFVLQLVFYGVYFGIYRPLKMRAQKKRNKPE